MARSTVENEDEAPDMTEYFTRAAEARTRGMTMIASVGLRVPSSMEHIIMPGEQLTSTTIVFLHPKPNWVMVMSKLEEQHAPMIVKWVMPIGHLPPLLPPPVN